MSKLSKRFIDKIKSDILQVLYESNLKPLYTKHIGDEIARDDELVMRLLNDLKKENVVKNVGNYKRRKKWVLTNEAYNKYKELIS
tara:strand:+ start:69081 stop:69335 length:255 start_codon:yes stop_codon:yes gene_type:complete